MTHLWITIYSVSYLYAVVLLDQNQPEATHVISILKKQKTRLTNRLSETMCPHTPVLGLVMHCFFLSVFATSITIISASCSGWSCAIDIQVFQTFLSLFFSSFLLYPLLLLFRACSKYYQQVSTSLSLLSFYTCFPCHHGLDRSAGQQTMPYSSIIDLPLFLELCILPITNHFTKCTKCILSWHQHYRARLVLSKTKSSPTLHYLYLIYQICIIFTQFGLYQFKQNINSINILECLPTKTMELPLSSDPAKKRKRENPVFRHYYSSLEFPP